MAAALAYAAFVGFLTIARGVPLTPDVLGVTVAFGLVLAFRGRIAALREWTPFLILLLAYELMRGLADDAGLPVHVADAVAAERLLFGGHLPTALLQGWLQPAAGPDVLAQVGTVIYLLHFPLPLVTALLLLRTGHEHLFHPYLVALILLSFAGFFTFLLLPVAPPWMAAQLGQLGSAPGAPAVEYLKPEAFAGLVGVIGLNGRDLYDLTFSSLNANPVAAFPSLHAAYPFLSFLVLRRAFGRIGWLAFAYFAFVVLTIVYSADHYVIDAVAGVAYATAAYWLMWRLEQRRQRGRAEG